ncbi:unnamed protein product, partial [Candidula unifasciata]
SSSTDMTHEQLQQHLQEQYFAMAGLQMDTQTQQSKDSLQTATLQAKLRSKDQEIRMLKSEHEQHMSAVLSHLLYLEGQMQKEQNHILEILHEKDDIIRRQKAAIADLVAKNNRYLQALKESHGYSADNGLVKPQGHVIQENGNIPAIQDHGNKVILRGNKNKLGEKVQPSSHKVRFRAMTDRLRRHKSSLELYHHEKLETLMEATPKYGSEENLVVDRSGKSSLFDRKERCTSLIDYPVDLFDVDEGLTESPDSCFSEDYNSPIISRNDSTSSLVTFNEKTPWNTSGLPSAATYGFNELSKSRSVPHALPTVAENDGTPAHLRGRPHSLPSVEMLPKDITTTPNSNKPLAASSDSSIPASPSTSSSQPASDSNPFKNFKNVFKRKGSKKKRTASMTSGKDQTDALKQHFKKYDMT